MVSYWTGPVLATTIDLVLSRDQEGVRELILVDNGNPPEVSEALARRAETDPRFNVIGGHGNVGFARGCNLGAGRARGRYLMLLNPDCWLAPGTVPALLAEAAMLGDDWMLGCRVRNPNGSDQRGARRALLTPVTALVEAFRLDRLSPRHFRRHRLNQDESPVPDRTARVPTVSGACMMLPAATFRSIGGMDEGYFLHVDDLDLCRRLHVTGIPVYFVPHVEATHYMSSSRVSGLLIEWHKTRGFLRYFSVHYGGPRWWPLLGLLASGILAHFALRALGTPVRLFWRPPVPRPLDAAVSACPRYPEQAEKHPRRASGP